MSASALHAYDDWPDDIDTSVSCSACDAVCCRLTVVLMPEDAVPAHLTTQTREGLHVMARGEDGWCIALDPLKMCCSIYDQRPGICRKFAMGSAYCRDERKTYRDNNAIAANAARVIPLTLY